MASADDRSRLKVHFDGPESSHPDRWAQLWNAGDFLPWDRGGPNPALVDLLDSKRGLIGDCFVEEEDGTKRRKTALVPGCGRGYDVLLLASYGYDAYGLEVSDKAVERCLEEKKTNGSKYLTNMHSDGAGTSTFLKGDFFAGEWNNAVTGGTFDLIYDYTVRFPCLAILPCIKGTVLPYQWLILQCLVLLRSEPCYETGMGAKDVAAFEKGATRTSHLP